MICNVCGVEWTGAAHTCPIPEWVVQRMPQVARGRRLKDPAVLAEAAAEYRDRHVVVIDAEEYESARRDPRYRALAESAKDYWANARRSADVSAP